MQWKSSCWSTACYWTPVSDSGLKKIHLQTLNNIFEWKQSEYLQNDIIMDTETLLELYTGRENERCYFSTTDSTTGPWRPVKRSLSLQRNCLTTLTVSVILSFSLQAEGNWDDTCTLFFCGPNHSGQFCSFVVFFYFYSHPSITGKSEPVNTMSQGLICILFTEHKFNLFLRGWIGSWRSEKLGIEIPLFPRNFHQNLILFPWKNTCGTLNL